MMNLCADALRQVPNMHDVLRYVNLILARAVGIKLAVHGNILRYERLQPSHSPVEQHESCGTVDYLSDAEAAALHMALLGLILLPVDGIMLIDAPEMFLCPAALHQMIDAIATRLSSGQIIIATHAPELIVSVPSSSLYFLDHGGATQSAVHIDTSQAAEVVGRLYGSDVRRHLLETLVQDDGNEILQYLLHCSTAPEPLVRNPGDPQLDQLAMWLNAAAVHFSQPRLTLTDVGAGRGDLLRAIGAGGCAGRVRYVPVEPESRHWSAITQAAMSQPELDWTAPLSCLSEVGDTDLLFLVNVMHELTLHGRVGIIAEAIRCTRNHGIIVIHEVAVLPKGETDFVMWDDQDYRDVLRESGIPAEVLSAHTSTRRGGWPLSTICIRCSVGIASEQSILDGARRALPMVLNRWALRLREDWPGVEPELRPRVKAFLLAQVATLYLWSME
jgi:hypothetical protein